MSSSKYILAIDQGTSSTKSLIFDEQGQAIAKGSQPLQTHYLNNGFVEQEPETIYQNVWASVQQCLEDFESKGFSRNEVAAIGISNQRETFVVWNKQGEPLYNAVVWQCKRSVQVCEALKAQGLSETINQKTGLVIDPYFSATKLIWLHQHNTALHTAIQNGEAYFGTIDTWLLYKFTNGQQYKTDYTNASRTLLFNLHTLQWDDELLESFRLKGIHLPALQASASFFGETTLGGLFQKPVAITAMIGDSHAAAFGEGCVQPGIAKATLGTGCSILMHVGNKPVQSNKGMVSTICWSTETETSYALEGVIVSCGATIEWLKNELQLFSHSKETATMAMAIEDNGGVYIVPAFSGLGSPHWQMDRKASIVGLTFGSTRNHVVRAALESIAYQIKDVTDAMQQDAGLPLQSLNVDGGITSNQFVISFLANLLNKQVNTIGMPDVSALGAAYLAGLKASVYESMAALQQLNASTSIHQPDASFPDMEQYYLGWSKAINGQ